MINFQTLYKSGIKAFAMGETVYDMFSGQELPDYTGKVLSGDDVMATWTVNGERAWRCVGEKPAEYIRNRQW